MKALAASGTELDWPHPEDGRTPIHAAACFDHVAALTALIDAGAGVNVKEASTGHTPIATAAIEGSARAVERLVAAGADVNAPDDAGLTPLMHAALAGAKAAAASLLKAGAAIEAGPGGVSAAELAAVAGHAAVAKAIGDEVGARRAAKERAVAEAAAAEKAAADAKAAEEKAAAEKLANEQAAERAAAARAAAEKAAADGAARASEAQESGAAPPAKVARSRMAAPAPGHAAATRLEVVQQGEDVVVKLHATEIVRLRPNGELTLSSGGWRTVSTLEAINGSVAELVPVRPQPHARTPDGAPAHRCAPLWRSTPPPAHAHDNRPRP